MKKNIIKLALYVLTIASFGLNADNQTPNLPTLITIKKYPKNIVKKVNRKLETFGNFLGKDKPDLYKQYKAEEVACGIAGGTTFVTCVLPVILAGNPAAIFTLGAPTIALLGYGYLLEKLAEKIEAKASNDTQETLAQITEPKK